VGTFGAFSWSSSSSYSIDKAWNRLEICCATGFGSFIGRWPLTGRIGARSIDWAHSSTSHSILEPRYFLVMPSANKDQQSTEHGGTYKRLIMQVRANMAFGIEFVPM
jgi:hypothetical protein